MPRFFFHVNGRTVDRDEVGTELPSPAYAKREGCKFIGALLVDGLLDRHEAPVSLEITDGADAVLFRLDITAHEAAMERVERSAMSC